MGFELCRPINVYGYVCLLTLRDLMWLNLSTLNLDLSIRNSRMEVLLYNLK